MYVTIDCDNLRFLRKHPDVLLLSNLAWIETPHISISIQPCDSPSFLSSFTDLELKMLYRNTTGQDQRFYGDALRAVFMELVQGMPLFVGTASEVERQAALIPIDNDVPYLYIAGASKPARQADLFELPYHTSPSLPSEPATASLGKRAASILYPNAQTQAAQYAAQVAEQRSTPATPQAKSAPRVAGTPRAGGVRDTVWSVADAMWELEGKPTERTLVLALRKRVMLVLEEEHAVKRTSSSNELGNWQKNRIV